MKNELNNQFEREMNAFMESADRLRDAISAARSALRNGTVSFNPLVLDVARKALEKNSEALQEIHTDMVLADDEIDVEV